MRIRDKNTEEEAPVNLMPLIDMVFLLLIFFLVATTFAQQERDPAIQLPAAAPPKALSEPDLAVINIDHEGSMTFGGEPITRDRLAARLRAIAETEKDRKVVLRADRESRHKYFADAAALCHEVGINPLHIAYIFDKSRAVEVE